MSPDSDSSATAGGVSASRGASSTTAGWGSSVAYAESHAHRRSMPFLQGSMRPTKATGPLLRSMIESSGGGAPESRGVSGLANGTSTHLGSGRRDEVASYAERQT